MVFVVVVVVVGSEEEEGEGKPRVQKTRVEAEQARWTVLWGMVGGNGIDKSADRQKGTADTRLQNHHDHREPRNTTPGGYMPSGYSEGVNVLGAGFDRPVVTTVRVERGFYRFISVIRSKFGM
uniref:Secreted protein n=1 Tax=Panagrellus redivivus TaxID=6233 RepID=A0A7E4V4S8_PANRE